MNQSNEKICTFVLAYISQELKKYALVKEAGPRA